MQRSKDKVSTSDVGKPGGVCPLGSDGTIPGKYIAGSSGSDSGLLDSSGKIDPIYISQGSGSGLNADTLDGKHLSDIIGEQTSITASHPISMTFAGNTYHLGLAASAEPAPGIVPIADENGKLNNWVDITNSISAFSVDIDGNLTPSEEVGVDDAFDYDSSGDIQPKQ